MVLVELFSQREKKRLGQGAPDVLQYDELPDPLRVQIVHIWREAIGFYVIRDRWAVSPPPLSNQVWHNVDALLCKELGVFSLGDRGGTPQSDVETYFLKAGTLDAVSVVEVVFREIEGLILNRSVQDGGFVSEVNGRFRQHAVGFQFESGTMMRVDTTYTHDEIVKPALILLMQKGFEGANAEFLRAHEHYRKGRHKEAVNEALKAFESTMKCICRIRKLSPYDPKW